MPEKIGRFRLVEELGKGAMSVVYKAFDPEINRTIAIKLLRGECATDPEYRSRFLQEAKAAGKLIHPNIVTIYDVGEAPAGPYIAMEYLEGMTLKEVMVSNNRVSLRETISYAIQLAEALAYSHASEVVHRDVKPGNIMLSPDRRTVRITDFGIAHIETQHGKQQMRMGTIVGTPQYMSPEQVDSEAVDGRSDLFSLGVILYELLTGGKPFSGDTLTTLLMEIVQKEPDPVSSKTAGIPESLERVVEKLLRKHPDKRFQNGKDLADALRQVLHELDEKERHQSEAGILPLRIKWTAVMAVVVAIAMVLGSYLVYRTQVESMTKLSIDSGSSLSEFIAVESAEALLIQDWIAIETFVDEIKRRQQISYLMIYDHEGILRGSTATGLRGGDGLHTSAALSYGAGERVLVGETVYQGEQVFDFKAPIVFQQKRIGSLRLGLSQAPLIAAAELTLYTMLGLLAAVVVIVSVVAYLLATGISLPLKLLRRAIVQASNGNYNHHIDTKRNDELGQLFNEYNKMADAFSIRLQEVSTPSTESYAGQPGDSTGAQSMSNREVDAFPAMSSDEKDGVYEKSSLSQSNGKQEKNDDESGTNPLSDNGVAHQKDDDLSVNEKYKPYDRDRFLRLLQQRLSATAELDGCVPLSDEPTLVIQPKDRK